MYRLSVLALILMSALTLGCDETSPPPVDENIVPVVTDIPDQTVEVGSTFATFDLDGYVSDADHADTDITWTHSGEDDLQIVIDADNVVTVTPPTADWIGSETITFTATDPGDLHDSDDAVFSVAELGTPIVSGIPDQTVQVGAPFVIFDLDDHVTDSNHTAAEITWTHAGEVDLQVDIDAEHLVTITPPSGSWIGSETIIFTATDPTDLSDFDAAIFTAQANAGAEYFFQLLGERINEIAEDLDEVDDPVEYLSNLDLSDLRAGFNGAFGEDPDDPIAHLGLAILDLLKVSYNEELIDFLRDLQEVDDDDPAPSGFRVNPLRGGLLGRHHQILAEAPLLLIQQTRELPVDLTAPILQNIIHDALMPEVTSAMTHAEAALDADDFDFTIEMDGEVAEIDKGEVYFFASALRELRAAFALMIAYDLDVAGPDGTYNWIEEMDELGGELSYEIHYPTNPSDGDTLYLDYYEYEEEILLNQLLIYWLRPGSDFLTLRDSPYSGETMIGQAHGDMIEALNLLEDGVAFIMAEGDSDPYQDDDLIKIGYLEDLNVEIDPDVDDPNFMQDWETVDDVIAWLRGILQGSFQLQETLEIDDGETVEIDITIDISALFTNPVTDWKGLLPYHEFLPEEQWIIHNEESYEESWNPFWEYWACDYDGYCFWFYNISYIYTTKDETGVEGMPLIFLDGPGGSEIDPEEELIYLPDYTLGGLFPGMLRMDWEALLGYDD